MTLFDDIMAAVVALEIHAETCGHARLQDDCPFCDDMRIVRKAKAALNAK